MMTRRPVAVRARRSAHCTASLPDEQKRIRSAHGTISQNSRAASVSGADWPP